MERKKVFLDFRVDFSRVEQSYHSYESQLRTVGENGMKKILNKVGFEVHYISRIIILTPYMIHLHLLRLG